MVNYTTISPPAPREKPVKEWMSRKEAASYLTRIGCPISPGTLANLAANQNAGKGPCFFRVRNGPVQYKRDDLDDWACLVSVRVGR